jgi:hypothetical protein
LIRAVLTSENKHGGIKHQLQDMVDMIPDQNPLKVQLREIESLAAYATAYRYPTPSGRVPDPPSKADFDDYVAKVSAGIDTAAAHFGVDMSAKDGPATRSTPMR